MNRWCIRGWRSFLALSGPIAFPLLLLQVTLRPLLDGSITVMESLREDGSFTGGLMLCEGLVQAREEYILQTNIEPVYYFHIGVPGYIVTNRN